MEHISAITSFLGWCTAINLGLYVFSVVLITICREPVKRIQSKISNIPSGQLDVLYFNFLGNYKLAILITNLVPYIALKVMVS